MKTTIRHNGRDVKIEQRGRIAEAHPIGGVTKELTNSLCLTTSNPQGIALRDTKLTLNTRKGLNEEIKSLQEEQKEIQLLSERLKIDVNDIVAYKWHEQYIQQLNQELLEVFSYFEPVRLVIALSKEHSQLTLVHKCEMKFLIDTHSKVSVRDIDEPTRIAYLRYADAFDTFSETTKIINQRYRCDGHLETVKKEELNYRLARRSFFRAKQILDISIINENEGL